jgi:hypothetical protein
VYVPAATPLLAKVAEIVLVPEPDKSPFKATDATVDMAPRPKFVRAVAAFVNALRLLPVASLPRPKFVRAPAAVAAPVPPLDSLSTGPASKSPSIVSRSAFTLVPQVSVDAPTSGLVKFKTAVKVSAIVGSGYALS